MMKEVKAVRDSAIESYVSTLTTQEIKDFAEMCTGSDWDLFPVEIEMKIQYHNMVERVVIDILKEPNHTTVTGLKFFNSMEKDND